MGDEAYKNNLRMEGVVLRRSTEQHAPHDTFVLNESESHSPSAPPGRLLKVTYKGTEPPPDTFKDDSQALAEGTYGRDGAFHANILQAKCASKYAPAQPGMGPAGPAATKPAAASGTAPAGATPAVPPANQTAAY